MKLILILSFLLFPILSPSIALAESGQSFYGKAPHFQLIDQSSNVFSSDSLTGKVWIANFIFTRCQGMCPLMSGQMMNLQDDLKGTDVRFVSFSVDPDYDTPQVLSDYAKKYRADESRWVFLTGDKSKIWELVSGGFMLGVQDASDEDLKQGAEPVMHSSRFVLVDREGNIRGFFDSTEPGKMKELLSEAQSL